MNHNSLSHKQALVYYTSIIEPPIIEPPIPEPHITESPIIEPPITEPPIVQDMFQPIPDLMSHVSCSRSSSYIIIIYSMSTGEGL